MFKDYGQVTLLIMVIIGEARKKVYFLKFRNSSHKKVFDSKFDVQVIQFSTFLFYNIWCCLFYNITFLSIWYLVNVYDTCMYQLPKKHRVSYRVRCFCEVTPSSLCTFHPNDCVAVTLHDPNYTIVEFTLKIVKNKMKNCFLLSLLNVSLQRFDIIIQYYGV
ncbi:hypothetical protein BDC45DRAFT_541118 [Circinella umbellata]|nr:hypothetical protein BDC45DRAFT_541118 [Circinella umbellata]